MDAYGDTLQILNISLVSSYCFIATAVLMIYDVLLTFDRELSTIWRRRCSLMTIIYIVNRYSLIVNIVPMLIWGFDGYLSTMCMVTNSISAVTTTLPIIAVAGFGAVRVHAMWEQSLWLSIPTFVLMLTPAWTNIQATVATYLEAIDPLPPPYGGCILATSNTQLELRVLQSISRATPIAGDALILAVTWCKTYRNMREAQRLGVQTKLTNLLLQDGTFYFGPIQPSSLALPPSSYLCQASLSPDSFLIFAT